VSRASAGHGVVTPDFLEQTSRRLDPAAPLHQCAQKSELETSEMNLFSVNEDFVSCRIDADRASSKIFLRLFHLTAAQDRSNAQQYLTRTERFGHVIVSAKFKSDDAVDLLRLCGQHHDRNVA